MTANKLHVQGCLAPPASGSNCYIVHFFAETSLGMVDETLEQRTERNEKSAEQIYAFLRGHLTCQTFWRLQDLFGGST